MEYGNKLVLAPMVRVVSCETLKPLIIVVSVFSEIYSHIKVDYILTSLIESSELLIFCYSPFGCRESRGKVKESKFCIFHFI